jgi:hypothetical protein
MAFEAIFLVPGYIDVDLETVDHDPPRAEMGYLLETGSDGEIVDCCRSVNLRPRCSECLGVLYAHEALAVTKNSKVAPLLADGIFQKSLFELVHAEPELVCPPEIAVEVQIDPELVASVARCRLDVVLRRGL